MLHGEFNWLAMHALRTVLLNFSRAISRAVWGSVTIGFFTASRTTRATTSLNSGWARRSARTSPAAMWWWWWQPWMTCFFIFSPKRSISHRTARTAITFCLYSIDWWRTRTFLLTAISCWTSRQTSCWCPRSTVSLWTSPARCVLTSSGGTTLWRTLRMTLHRAPRAVSATCTPLSCWTSRSTSAFLRGGWTSTPRTPRRRARTSPGSTLLWQTSRPTFHRTTRAASTTCTPFSDGTARSTWAFLCQAARPGTWHRTSAREIRQHAMYQ